MTNLKIEDRKNTTEAGVEALKDLIDSFEFEADIDTVESQNFDLRADIGGDNGYVWSDRGYWRIKEGEIDLYGDVEGFEDTHAAAWSRITKIDFGEAMKALETTIEGYNQLCIKKDTEIETFLAVCKAIEA